MRGVYKKILTFASCFALQKSDWSLNHFFLLYCRLNLMAALKSLKPTVSRDVYVATDDTSLPVFDAVSGEWF
jgi:hypothetical protein